MLAFNEGNGRVYAIMGSQPRPVFQICSNQKYNTAYFYFYLFFATREHTISLMIKCLSPPLPVHPDHNFTQETHLPRSFPQPRPMTPKITYLKESCKSLGPVAIRARLEHFLIITQSVL